MKRIMPWVVMPLLASFPLVACDSDDGEKDTTSDTSDTSDTTQPGDTDTTQPGVSALTGVNTNVTVTAPTPNASCNAAEVDDGDYGTTYPWGGLTVAGVSYTCNRCPSGLPNFQGSYRWFGYEEDKVTPDYDQGGNAATGNAELLLIDGNTWYSKLYIKDGDITEEKRGYFFCSQQPENPNKHLFWFITEVVDDGGTDVKAGDVERSNVILESGTNKLIEWFDEVTGPGVAQFSYCKIGTTSGGKTCNNPFN